jgi:hypothetical protein
VETAPAPEDVPEVKSLSKSDSKSKLKSDTKLESTKSSLKESKSEIKLDAKTENNETAKEAEGQQKAKKGIEGLPILITLRQVMQQYQGSRASLLQFLSKSFI